MPRLVKFVDQLTNWYVRMNRRRLKGEGGINDCKQALQTLFSVLYSMTKVMVRPLRFNHWRVLSLWAKQIHSVCCRLTNPSGVYSYPSIKFSGIARCHAPVQAYVVGTGDKLASREVKFLHLFLQWSAGPNLWEINLFDCSFGSQCFFLAIIAFIQRSNSSSRHRCLYQW